MTLATLKHMLMNMIISPWFKCFEISGLHIYLVVEIMIFFSFSIYIYVVHTSLIINIFDHSSILLIKSTPILFVIHFCISVLNCTYQWAHFCTTLILKIKLSCNIHMYMIYYIVMVSMHDTENSKTILSCAEWFKLY